MHHIIFVHNRFSLWLFAHRKFMARDRQCYVVDKRCIVCGDHDDCFEHLFFKCRFSRALWNNVKRLLGMNKVMGMHQTLLKAFRDNYQGTSSLSKIRCVATAAVVYHLWNARTRCLFAEKQWIEDIQLYLGNAMNAKDFGFIYIDWLSSVCHC